MTYHPQVLSSGCNDPLSPRACQTCHTTVTSQWRYGLSGKMLLCNACGIRWKRKNRTTGKRRLKPGPKRARQCTVSTMAPYSYVAPSVLQPSLSSIFYKPSMYSLTKPINSNFSSSSTITDARTEIAVKSKPGSASQQQASSGYTRSSKMDLGCLVCPMNTSAIVKPQITDNSKPVRSEHSSQISIRSLLNFSDEHATSTICSTTTPVQYA